MNRRCNWLVLLLATLASSARGAESAGAASGLVAALAKNVAHARDWLEQKDYKSLAQSAGGLLLLAEVTKAKGDDGAWQAALGGVVARAGELQAAARGEDAAKCQAAVEALDAAVAAAAKMQPKGQPQEIAKPPAIRLLMLTMDAVQADGKIALMIGNVEAAKKQAHVLAELSRLVSNSKQTDQWAALAGDFSSAANAAATSSETDAKVVRQQFRVVAEKCEACHEKGRMR